MNRLIHKKKHVIRPHWEWEVSTCMCVHHTRLGNWKYTHVAQVAYTPATNLWLLGASKIFVLSQCTVRQYLVSSLFLATEKTTKFFKGFWLYWKKLSEEEVLTTSIWNVSIVDHNTNYIIYISKYKTERKKICIDNSMHCIQTLKNFSSVLKFHKFITCTKFQGKRFPSPNIPCVY